MADVEIETVWIQLGLNERQEEEEDIRRRSVESMLEDGWELVQWQPVITSDPEYGIRQYDVFLLRRTND